MGRLLTETPYSEITATMEIFDYYGVTREQLTKIRANKNFAQLVSGTILEKGGLRMVLEMTKAAEIMGINFFGPEDWKKFYGIKLSGKQLHEIEVFPWGVDTLNSPCPFYPDKTIKETHFAFLGLDKFKGKPFTILQWQKINPNTPFYNLSNWSKEECEEEFVAKNTTFFRWYLMPVKIVPKSINKTFDQQKSLLPSDYEVPTSITEITKFFLYVRKHKYCPITNVSGRCEDKILDGKGISVGYFTGEGFRILRYGRHKPLDIIGLAASRKLPPEPETHYI